MAISPGLIIAFTVAAYLLGSIPTGIIMSRLFGGTDPRKVGSGNIGATNVGRSAGRLAGILTLVGDALKGGLPAYLAAQYELGPLVVSLVGGAAFAGHLFPVFLGFKGGKGVATALGVMVAIAPFAALLSACVFVALVAIKRYVSLGSIVAAAFLPVFLSLIPDGKAYVPLAVFISALVVIKHKDNIKRLINGTENRVFKGKG